jgi:phage head maturation protease
MSFMFTIDRDSWDDIESDHPTRHIRSIVRVFEVSAVTFPAYAQTSIQARGVSDALESAKESLESARQALMEERAAQAENERRTAALERLNKLIEEVKANV